MSRKDTLRRVVEQGLQAVISGRCAAPFAAPLCSRLSSPERRRCAGHGRRRAVLCVFCQEHTSTAFTGGSAAPEPPAADSPHTTPRQTACRRQPPRQPARPMPRGWCTAPTAAHPADRRGTYASSRRPAAEGNGTAHSTSSGCAEPDGSTEPGCRLQRRSVRRSGPAERRGRSSLRAALAYSGRLAHTAGGASVG
jgi:hypothetical protein